MRLRSRKKAPPARPAPGCSHEVVAAAAIAHIEALLRVASHSERLEAGDVDAISSATAFHAHFAQAGAGPVIGTIAEYDALYGASPVVMP